jgi:hypothetical protein
MKRRTQGVLLVGSLAVASVVVLAAGLARGVDHQHCKIGFLRISCTWSSTAVTRGIPSTAVTTGIPSSSFTADTTPSSSVTRRITRSNRRYGSGYDDVTSWAVTSLCPQDYIPKRLPCAVASVAAPAQAASDDLEVELSDSTGLPLPKRRVLTTAKNSALIKAVYVETPRDLAAVLGFYRAELSKRGWTENDGAVVEADRAVIVFTTTDGPAMLRLIHQDDRTIADLSLRKLADANADILRTIANLALRKLAAANAGILPTPGQVRLMLGNDTDEEAVITINERTITLAARAGHNLTDAADAKRKSPDSPEIDLSPGKYKVTLKVASSAAQNRELEVAADEAWGLLVGPAGVPLPVHLY